MEIQPLYKMNEADARLFPHLNRTMNEYADRCKTRKGDAELEARLSKKENR